MKRASYREAIRWIAENDSAGDEDACDPKVASELITSALVADLFGVEDSKVGEDVVRLRRKALPKTYLGVMRIRVGQSATSIGGPAALAEGDRVEVTRDKDSCWVQRVQCFNQSWYKFPVPVMVPRSAVKRPAKHS